MKKCFPIFLSLTVLLQSLAGTILVLNYQAQKKYIASTLCENKNKPSKGCQGKCFLKKQLKKAEEAEKSLPGSVKEKMEVAYTLHVVPQYTFFQPVLTVEHASLYHFTVLESPTFTDPHPPRV